MIRMPDLGGPEQFRLFLAEIPRRQALQLLDVDARTLRRWCAEDGRPPRAALHALFWHTRWGDSLIRSFYGFEAANRLHLAPALAALHGVRACNEPMDERGSERVGWRRLLNPRGSVGNDRLTGY